MLVGGISALLLLLLWLATGIYTVGPGAFTTLALETREWDAAVQHFMAQVSRRRWWSRWWRRRKLAVSFPLTFTMLHADGEASQQRYVLRLS